MAQKGPVEFKGKLNGLYLNLDPNEDFDVIMAYLNSLLINRASFYKGSRIVGVKGKELNYKQKAAIEALIFDQFEITVDSLEDISITETNIERIVKAKINEAEMRNDARESTDKASEVEIKTETKVEVLSEIKSEVKPDIKEEKNYHAKRVESESTPYVCDTHFVFGTMRSGKSVHFPGHVVVIGDINPGAEVVAEGNIIVMGRVLGFIHAGSAGNDKAIIIANLLKPTQIRISTYISVPPSDDESHHTNVPEKATVSGGVIKIEKCH